jgi:hypothetical protein
MKSFVCESLHESSLNGNSVTTESDKKMVYRYRFLKEDVVKVNKSPWGTPL